MPAETLGDRIRPFEQHAERYDAWYEDNAAAYEAERAALGELVGEVERGLEVGVGTGRFAPRLGIRVGLEPAAAMAEIARRRGVEVVRGVGERLPFADERFDTVLAVALLAFLSDPGRALAEARRVLEPGGRLVLGLLDAGSPVGASRFDEGCHGLFDRVAGYRTAREAAELLESEGFELEAARQTIFDPLDEIEAVPSVRDGAGEGLFAALRATKRA